MINRKHYQFLYVVLGLFAALAIFFYAQSYWSDTTHETANNTENDLEIEESPAMENPLARWEYERGMLADPKTDKVPVNIRRKELAFGRDINTISPVPGASPNDLGRNDVTEGVENSSFVSVGPFNLGGRTRALALDVTNENIILAGGVTGGVWRSTNAGQSWTKTSSPLDFPVVSTIVQDKRTGHTSDWYFGGGEFFGNSAASSGAFHYGDGIYRSTDGGQSWSPIANTQVGDNVEFGPFSVISELAIDNSNTSQTEIYVGGISGIIRSTDSGFNNITLTLGQGNQGVNYTDVLVSSTGRVYASIANSDPNGSNPEEGIFTSPDGINWTDITPTELPETYSRIELALDPTNENLLYAVGGMVVGSNTTDFLLRYNFSTDTWTDLSDNMDSSSDIGEGHNMQQGYNLYVKVHPEQSNTVFIGGTNIIRSGDGFASTNTRQVGGYQSDNNPNSFGDYINHHPDQHSAVFLPSNGDIMISGNDGGLYRTENNRGTASGPNPVSWTSLNNGYITTQFYSLDYLRDARGDRRVSGGMQDNGSWINYSGQNDGDWTRELGGDGAYTAMTYNSLYMSAQEGQMRRYTLNGSTGEFDLIADVSPSSDRSEFLFINPFIVNPVNQDQLFVGADSKVYYTDDIRQNPGPGQWQSFTASGMSGERISALAASIQPAGVLYVGTRNGEVYKVEDTRNITSATAVTATAMPDGATVSGIGVDPEDADRVFVTFSNYGVVSVWMSENGGDTWTAIGGNLEENPDGSGNGPSIRWVEVLPDGNGGSMIFLGTSIGLYMTDTVDGDNTVWSLQSENTIGVGLVVMIKVRPNEGQVVAATHGNGVFTGTYDVKNTPTINYSVVTPNEELILRGPTSSISGQGFEYQWLRNGEAIEGATASTLNITNGGTYKLRLTDEIDQSVSESNELVFFLDNEPPTISSITRLSPVDEEVEVTEVTFQVSFDEEVQNVSTEDFEVTGDVSGTISSVVPVFDNQAFDVIINSLGGQGTLGLGVSAGNDISDLAGNAFSGTITSAETYTITDNTVPTAVIIRVTPSTEITSATTLIFGVVFTEVVTNVDATDFVLSSTSVASATISSVNQGSSSTIYSVVVDGISESGTVDLDFATSQDIEDLGGNAFAGTITSEESYEVELTVTSIDDPTTGPGQVGLKTNPSDGVFLVTLSDAYLGGFELKVVNGNGQEVLSDSRDHYQSGTELSLDLTDWPDGLYLLNVAGKERKDVVKLLKQKR